MKKENNKRSSFSGKIGFVLSAAGASVGLGEYLEISLSGCKVWRWYLSGNLYYSGIDVRLCNDCGRDIDRTYDRKKPGRSLSVLWQIRMAGFRGLDQCDYSDSDCAILFSNRRLGH